MKLIRLTTEEENGTFDNIFNDDLTLKKDSKVALLSLSMETQAHELDITNANQKVDYQILNSEGTRSVLLTTDFYDQSNFRDLFQDIENKLNGAAGVDTGAGDPVYSKYYGLEWKCSENSKNEVFVKYEKGGYAEFTDNWVYDQTKVERLANGIWRQKGGQPNDTTNQRNAKFKEYIANGCGFVRCRTNLYNAVATTAPGENGYIIGLSETDFASNPDTTPTDAQLNYGIAVTCNAAGDRKYYTVENGVYTISATNPNFIGNGVANNDFQEVVISKGNIDIRVYQNGSADSTTLAQFPHTPGQKLYPFIIFRGSDVNLNGLRLTPSPYSNAPATYDGTLFAPPRPTVPALPSNNMIKFSESLAKFLGFENPRNPQNGFIEVAEPTFTAESQFKLLDIADAYLVEMLNLKLDSYDGFKNQRKNILAVINNNETINKIIYEANNPVFIDLANLSDILLRNLRVRVVRSDYSLIEMRGEASMVLLVDSN